MSARTHHLPDFVSIKQLARLLKVDERTIRRWQKPGDDGGDENAAKPIPWEKRGTATVFPLAAAIAWFVDYRVGIAAKPVSELDLARQRKLAIESEMAELELARLRGNVVAVELVEARMTKIATTLRAQLLAVPGRYSPRLVGLPTLPAAQQAMDDIVRSVLTEFAEHDEQDDFRDPDGDGARPAA